MSLTRDDETYSPQFMRVIRSELRESVRNVLPNSLTSSVERAMSDATPDQQTIINTPSGPVQVSRAPFEKSTPTQGFIAYARTSQSDFPDDDEKIGHSYNSISQKLTPELAQETLTNIASNNLNISYRSRGSNTLGNQSSNKTGNQVAAILTVLGLVSESARTGQRKANVNTLKKIADGSLSATDALTKKGAEGQASFIQAAPGGKQEFRNIIGSGELPEHVEIAVDEWSDSSDEDTANNKRDTLLLRKGKGNGKRTRITDMSDKQQVNTYSILIETKKKAINKIKSLSSDIEKEFFSDNFSDLYNRSLLDQNANSAEKPAAKRAKTLDAGAVSSNRRVKISNSLASSSGGHTAAPQTRARARNSGPSSDMGD